MKTPAAVFCVALALQGFLAGPAQAQTMRCKNDLAQVGDGKASVLQKCGEPVFKDSFCKPVERQPVTGNGQPPVVVHVQACDAVDEWTYNPGRGQFLTTLRFEAGTLRSIAYGDRVK
jgi:Protein of unknown function (DUF2845)